MDTNSANSSTAPADAVSSASIASTGSILNKSIDQKSMQWWYFGPVVLAIMMFLLMGTIFERRIEGVWRHILERRQVVPSTTTESTETAQDTNSVPNVRTASQRSIGSFKAGTTTTGDGETKLETRSCIFPKKYFMGEDATLLLQK